MIARVLGLALVLLLVAFRSFKLALAVIGLNLLSVGATYGILVAVFAIFATLRLLDMTQLGFGLAAAVLLDATLVRGVALPAAVALLGDRDWRVRRRAPVRPQWDHGRPAVAAGGSHGS